MLYLLDIDDTLLTREEETEVHTKTISGMVQEGIDPLKINETIKKIKAETGREGRVSTSVLCGRLNCLDLYYHMLGSVVGEREGLRKLFDSLRAMGRQIGLISGFPERTMNFLMDLNHIEPDLLFCGDDKANIMFWHELANRINPQQSRVIGQAHIISVAKSVGFRTRAFEGKFDVSSLKYL